MAATRDEESCADDAALRANEDAIQRDAKVAADMVMCGCDVFRRIYRN